MPCNFVRGVGPAPGSDVVDRQHVPLHLLVQCEQPLDERSDRRDLKLVEAAAVECVEGELPRPGRVEQRRVAVESREQRMLAQQRRCEGVVGLDSQLVRIDIGALGEDLVDAAAHLLRGLDGEGEAEDVARTDASADELDDRQSERLRLAGARAGCDPHGAVQAVEDLALLVGQAHSGASPPKWRGQIRLNSHHWQSAV
jgi:hypothetical protein